MHPDHPARQLIGRSRVHAEWRPLLLQALEAVDPDYLQELIDDPDWLPGPEQVFAAFRRDRRNCRYLLFGESPYPRPESANGIAFQDASVSGLWSENGLSKAVNRATSLRNLIKTALLAEGHLQADAEGRITQQAIARLDKSRLVGSLDAFFAALEARGVLAFNALPVLHAGRGKTREARRWHGFLERLLQGLRQEGITLVLWGRIAEDILALPGARHFRVLQSEHPYNVSFIHNPVMRRLFADWRLLGSPPQGTGG